MNNQSILKMFRCAALVCALSAATQIYAANTVDYIVAVVDSSVILNSELDQATDLIKAQMQQRKENIPPEDILRQNTLDQLILRAAQVEQVKRFGVQTDENTLNNAILNIAKQQGITDLAQLQRQMDSKQEGSYARLRTEVAQELSINRLRQQQVMSRIQISDRDIENFLKSPQGQAAIGGQIRALHLRISPVDSSTNTTDVQKVAQSVKKALDTSDDINAIAQQFSTAKVKVEGADMGLRQLSEVPADLAARLASVKVGQTTETIRAADGLHVLKLLERRGNSEKALVQQYLTRHILVQPSEVVSPEDAKQRIDQLYDRLEKGANFSDLAATYSTDPGSAADGGSLGWVSPGSMVPVFEKVMKETPKGQISKPFQSQYGWHILTVENTREMDMTEEAQHRMARQILGERQFETEIDSWLREVRANAYVDIKDPSLKK